MADVQEYIGKRVELTLDDDGEQLELLGTVESANSMGFVFKPFGSPKISLYETAQVLEINPAPEKEPVLKSRRLDPVAKENVKRHLVDRHGYPLDSINEMSADEAFTFHAEQVDHGPLSHYHAVRPVKAEADPNQGELDLGVNSDDDDDDEPDF